MSWLRRLLNALRPSRVQRDIDRELAFHLAEREDELRAGGLSAAEAARRARVQFGNPLRQAERTGDIDIARWPDAVARNVRYALRGIGRAPGFAVTVVLTLAFAIGANAAVFSVIDAVLLQPLPYPDADRLVQVRQVGETTQGIAPARLEDWRRLSDTFEALTGYYVEDVSDTTGAVPERVRRAIVAPDFLEVWGVQPAIGRGLTGADHARGAKPILLVSDRYWRQRLGGDPAALDRPLRIEGQSFGIAGVMPSSFLFADPEVDLWRPVPVAPLDVPPAVARTFQWYTGVGRLRDDVTAQQALADLAVVQAQLAREYPDTDAGLGVRVVDYRSVVVGDVRESLWMLFGAVTVLLLIACTNIAALLLSRAGQREHELSVRFSLGASRLSVAGQLLTETLVLALGGAAGGLLLASGAADALRLVAPEVPRLGASGVDARILAYTAATAFAVSLLCGVLPAVRGTRRASALSAAGRTQVSAGHGVQWVLVGAQVALSVILLSGAGLLVRSVAGLARVDRGFDASNVLAFRVSGNWSETSARGRLLTRIDTTIDELGGLPGVEAVATSWSLPGVPTQFAIDFDLVEGRSRTDAPLSAEWRTVSPAYFSTLRIAVIEGGLCQRSLGKAPPSEVLVNRAFARRYFPGRSVLGLHLQWEQATQGGTIVGVVADAREAGLDREPAPTVYACYSAPTPFPWFLVRTYGDAAALAPLVRERLARIEPLRFVYDVEPLEARIGGAYALNRVRTTALVLFAGTALFMACVGIYGTLAYVIGLRRREVGLRLALGAGRTTVIAQLVGRGLRVVALGCAVGLVLSLALAGALSGMLYGVSPSDPLTLASVLGLVLAVGSAAALAPAVRATLVEPIRVLRNE